MRKFYFSPILFLLVLSCTSGPEGAKNTNDTSVAAKADVHTLLPPQPTVAYFCTLKLDRKKFEILQGYYRPNKKPLLVFQFRYDASADSVSPRLVAYVMKEKHESDEATRDQYKEYLDSLGPSNVPITGERILGDLQAKIKAFKDLIDASGHAGDYTHFLFTPKYNTTNKHIYYHVEVVPSNKTDDKPLPEEFDLNPSPPYSAE